MWVNRVKRGLLAVNVRTQGETWVTWGNMTKDGATWVTWVNEGKQEQT